MTTPEPIEYDDLDERIDAAVEEAEAMQSWDDFWAEIERERGGPRTETIRGVEVTVPHDLPLRFEFRAEQTKSARGLDAITPLLADLFGADVMDAWIEAGMTLTEFQVALYWGMSHGRGRPITFRQAYEQVLEREQGKARQETESSPEGSSGSGGRSKPISRASTGSRRSRSRT